MFVTGRWPSPIIVFVLLVIHILPWSRYRFPVHGFTLNFGLNGFGYNRSQLKNVFASTSDAATTSAEHEANSEVLKSTLSAIKIKTKGTQAKAKKIKSSNYATKQIKGVKKIATDQLYSKSSGMENENNKKAKNSSSKSPREKPPNQKNKYTKTTAGPKHWIGESDNCSIQFGQEGSDSGLSLIRFIVRGNPLPLRRHRTARGYMYNPSSAAQISFRNVTKAILYSIPDLSRPKNENEMFPLFAHDQPVIMTIAFRMQRPKKHFVGGMPGPGRMRDYSPPALSPIRTDVDNLAKFVMDSMNGLLYEDDRQVASLLVTKLLDNEGSCQGSTEVCVRTIRDQDLSTL